MKLPSWFSPPSDKVMFWTSQVLFFVTFISFFCQAIWAEGRRTSMVMMGLAGLLLGIMSANGIIRRLFRICIDQQKLIREQRDAMEGVLKVNVEAIGRTIAENINADIVSIEGPDGPINPNPTKH